jgi:hypothetical protein
MTTETTYRITEIKRPSEGSAWVSGTSGTDYAFQALVFAEHAESELFELGQSRISKLWVYRKRDRQWLYNFDRGLDVAPANNEVAALVDLLAANLADTVHHA